MVKVYLSKGPEVWGKGSEKFFRGKGLFFRPLALGAVFPAPGREGKGV